MIQEPSIAAISTKVLTGLSKIGLAMRNQDWMKSKSRKMHPTHSQVLAILHSRAPQPMGLSEIASLLGVTSATASDSVGSLESKGMIRKKRSKGDGRAVSIELTTKGKKEADRSVSWPDVLVRSVHLLSEEERKVFYRALVKMIHFLQEEGSIPIQRMCVGCQYFRPNVHKDPQKPHHCAFADSAFGETSIHLDCKAHHPASPEQADRNWKQFTGGKQ